MKTQLLEGKPMQHRLLFLLLTGAIAACSSATKIATVDSCTGQTGTCVAVQINDASPSVGSIDSFEVALTGAVTKRGTVQFPSAVATLPVTVALLLPDVSGAITITVGAVHAGLLVGAGSAQATAAAGQQSQVSVSLKAVCAGGACATGQGCVLDSDCASRTCDPKPLICTPTPVPVVASAATSIVSSPASASTGVTFQVSLQAKDAAGNSLATGAATVVFTSSNTAVAAVGATVDNGNGTYSATVSPAQGGTITLGATLNGAAVVSTAQTVISAPVTAPTACVITAPSTAAPNSTVVASVAASPA